METRKVYKSGGSTFVVSLPKRWATKTGIKEGDSVLVRELGGTLSLSAGSLLSVRIELSSIRPNLGLARI
jgi:phosphate uptake regulator